MVDFEVRRDGTLEDGVFDVAPLTDTANPFGDFVVVKIDDRGGQKFDLYERGTKVEVTINDDGTTYDRFTGYVVERREGEQQGSDTLEVEAYSFDQFLRRNTVSTDLTGKTIPEALQSIVDNDSPVTYNSAKVEVVDDQELTRSFRGEPVEEVLRDLAFKSGNENFGVDDSLEFFFRPRESVHIDRGIDNTQWFRYDIPELGKEVVNEVEVWYNDGNESVIIDAPTDKLDLQDNLGLANPGTQRAELQRPQITTTQDAGDVGRRYLQFRNATLSGTVTTYGLYEAEPGDTINIEIKPRGIDTEFVIASVEYRWGVDETTLTIVEKRGDQDDILFELNDSVKRQELEGADRDAPSNRVTTTDATALFDVTVDADGNTPDAVKFVNAGRNAMRDAWSGQGNPDVSTITVGSDGSGLSRSNTDLSNQTNSVSVNQSTPTSTSIEYTTPLGQTDSGTVDSPLTGENVLFLESPIQRAVDFEAEATGVVDGDSIEVRVVNNGNIVTNNIVTSSGESTITAELKTDIIEFDVLYVGRDTDSAVDWNYQLSEFAQDNVQEVGLKTSTGTLISRAVFDEPINIRGQTTITIDVSNDESVSRGVLTNDGQIAVRDTLADNNPDLPTDYAYGSDGTPVSESDTALGTELKSVSLAEILQQSADTTTEWDNITTIANTNPVDVGFDSLDLLQTAFVFEGEDSIASFVAEDSDTSYSGGAAYGFQGGVFQVGDKLEYSFTPGYDIENYDLYVREKFTSPNADGDVIVPEITLTIDNTSTTIITDGSSFIPDSEPEWTEIVFNPDNFPTLSEGNFTKITFEVTNANEAEYGDYWFDVVALVDSRYYNGNFDNTVHQDNGYLDEPQLYPSSVEQALNTATFDPRVDGGKFNSTWTDTTGNQYVEVSPDGSTYTRFDNTSSATFSFGSTTQSIDTNLGLSRYPPQGTNPQNATPRFGYNGQSVDLWELFVNPDTPSPDDIGVTNARAIVPANSGLNGNTIREAGLKSGSTLLTRHQLAEFVVQQDQRLASSESTKFTGDE